MFGPKVEFRDGQKQKEIMKNIQMAIITATLAATMSASADLTYSGNALNNLDYAGNPGDAQYVSGTPDLAQLYTADLSTADTADSPAVFIQITTPITLNSFAASYDLGAGSTVDPYWVLYLTDDPGYGLPIVSTDGGAINGSSLVHTGDLINGSISLSALDATIDPNSGLLYGQSTVAWAGLEIGDGGSGAGTANIESITISTPTAVPEPTTVISGALLLLPIGASAVRMLRKRHTA